MNKIIYLIMLYLLLLCLIFTFDYGAQVLDGLMFLHNKKQLHRDIKPGNILINCNGDVRIADFGLAKVASVRNCHQNSFVGTLSYMVSGNMGLRTY